MDLGKRCLCGPLPPANARRDHGRGPPRKPENLGPARNVPAKLGGEAGADRTNGMFDFDYVHENCLPKNKRKFGSYVLPILWGDRFIGRVDPQMDREHERLLINSVHAEPGTPGGKEVSLEIRETIGHLAEFLGAKEVVYTARVPRAWRNSLR